MKNNNINSTLSKSASPGITIDNTIKNYTEENSPFIKRKMKQARAILSKSPLPDFKNMSIGQKVKK